jgi:hypothetical protein
LRPPDRLLGLEAQGGINGFLGSLLLLDGVQSLLRHDWGARDGGRGVGRRIKQVGVEGKAASRLWRL